MLKRLNHSHPRTYRLLNRLSKRNNIDLISVNVNPSLYDLCSRIYVNSLSKKKITVEISTMVNDNSNNPKRLYNCYSFWLPYCLKIANKISKSFMIQLNASDWGFENFLSMTSEDPNNLIPDEYAMYESRILNKMSFHNDFSDFEAQWIKRKSIMFWRGSTTGKYINSTFDLKDLIRVKACLSVEHINQFDMKISSIVQNRIPKQIIIQWLRQHNIISRRVDESKFLKYKYYPDLPGNNTLCGSWGVIRKYLRGNLVFRPAYKSLMYYDRFLEPWKHYIPIHSDFSDLYEKLMWAENNQNESVRIAWNGFSISKEYLNNIDDYFMSSAMSNMTILA
tara:strand:+ start:1176 stop:2183 length:1008 start_codon:yes stop_codon:yes gene_type:complete